MNRKPKFNPDREVQRRQPRPAPRRSSGRYNSVRTAILEG